MMLCAADFAILHLPGPAPVSQSWRLDVASALIGAVVALLLAGLLYRYRDSLRLAWEDLAALVARWRGRLQASTEDRYRDLVARWAQSVVVPPGAVSVDSVFVEPRLLPPLPAPQSLPEVELLPDSPRPLPLRQALGGHPRLVILGTPGAGRTALLACVARSCTHAVRGASDTTGVEAALGPVRDRLPLYVPLPAMDWNATGSADGQAGGGTEMLLLAAVAAVGGGGGMVRPLRQRLEAGQAVVLVDGWDELSPQPRQQAAAWLAGLVDAWPGNLWLVSAATRGYASLAEMGFVPVTLAAWDAAQVETFAQRWVETGTPGSEPDSAILRRLSTELGGAARSGVPPFELALRALVARAGGAAPAGRAALFDRALDVLLGQEEPWVSDACRAVLGQVALRLQQEGRATAGREEIDRAIESVLPPPEERPARAAARVSRALTGPAGWLRLVGTDRTVFAHPLWQAYLAARQLAATPADDLVERLDDPCWAEVLRFYAGLGDVGPLVASWCRRPADIFLTHLQTLSSWIAVAPGDAAWRDGAMAVLARAFLHPSLPGPVRQALADALAATGAPGLAYFFSQAIQHPDAGVRAAAVLGLARTGGESVVLMIEPALGDESVTVREAAVRGLAHASTDAATRQLARVLMEGDEMLGPVVAEALAQCGKEGVAFLREAVVSEDVIVRRAAVFGLAQIEARDLLERVAREDSQWIVRSAASAAMDELAEWETICGVAPPPKIEGLPWLTSWAAARGSGVGVGEAARGVLRRAMSEGDAPVRLAAARVLAQVGRPDDVESLRIALNDADPAIGIAALDALAEIDRRYDLRIEPSGSD